MLKISHARLQHYVNQEFPGVQAGFRKGRRARDQIENICWIIEKAIPDKKNSNADKGLPSQGYGFSSSLVWVWELGYKKSWAPKNWCFLTVVLEKTLESPLDCWEIKPIHPTGNQSWIFIGRTVAEAETPILWPPNAKSWLIWKDPDAGKDWEQKEKRVLEDERAGRHHRCNELGQTPGRSKGQGSLVCCSPRDGKESDTAGQLNNKNNNFDLWIC